MERKIKFIGHGKRWFDKVNGNTYHSVTVTRVRDGKIIGKSFRYGYDDAYRQTAIELMAEKKFLPVKYRKRENRYLYERENNYPIEWIREDTTKKDMINHGIV